MQLSCMFDHTSPLAHPAALITCRQCENLTVHLAAGLLHHIFIIIFHEHNKKHKDKQNYLYKNVCNVNAAILKCCLKCLKIFEIFKAEFVKSA